MRYKVILALAVAFVALAPLTAPVKVVEARTGTGPRDILYPLGKEPAGMSRQRERGHGPLHLPVESDAVGGRRGDCDHPVSRHQHHHYLRDRDGC